MVCVFGGEIVRFWQTAVLIRTLHFNQPTAIDPRRTVRGQIISAWDEPTEEGLLDLVTRVAGPAVWRKRLHIYEFISGESVAGRGLLWC
jgi:hypothetical protein